MTTAHWSVVLFAEKYGLKTGGSLRKDYYVEASAFIQ